MTNNFLQSFSQIIMRLKVKKIYSLSVLIFTIVFLFSWWSHPSLIPKTSPDSWGYMNLAKDINHEISEIRPFFFPIFIKFCMSISEIFWKQIFSIIQILFHALICTSIFHLFIRFKFKKIVSFLMTLIIGFNPSLIYYSTYLLADHFLAVLTTLSWLFTIIFIQNDHENKERKYYLFLIGIFSGLAVVTKPIAILGIVPLLFTYIILSKRTLYMLRAILIILIINYSFYFSWEMYKKYNNPNLTFELLDYIEYSVNMTAIRGGLVDYGIGTPLYNEIKKKALLESAREFRIKLSYAMDGDTNYWNFNKSLSWDIKNDKEFAKNILREVPIKLFSYSISNWHAFFTKRCFGPGEGSFPYMPDLIRYIYIVGYGLLYRPLLFILLFFSFIILWRKRFLILFISSGSMLLYASLAIVLLTPHGGEFPRYRVWIEYIMWFCALFPIGYLFENLIMRLKKI